MCYKHLDLDTRIAIQNGLKENKNFTEIANETGVHKSTIGREVKSRRRFIHHKKVATLQTKNVCVHRYKCEIKGKCKSPTCFKRNKNCKLCGMCNDYCKEFEEEVCTKYTLAPYVCNGCPKKGRCPLSKWVYDAKAADKEYESVLSESRQGISLNTEELERIDKLVSPQIKNGQSVRSVCDRKKDKIMVSTATVYKLLNEGYLDADLFDLKRTLQRKPTRKKAGPPVLVDGKCRIGRTYEDYKKYMDKHPDKSTVEMDTVEGKKGGKVALTLLFKNCNLQLAFLRDHNDAASVSKVFKDLRNILEDDFVKLFPVCLGDRGSEFSDPIKIEVDIETGEVQGKVFYCDPQNSGQKGGCEKNHQFIRYVIPKGTSLDGFTQDDIDFMMNNINSYGREKYNGKSPYELFKGIYGAEIIKKLGIILIPADDIVLTPELLKK